MKKFLILLLIFLRAFEPTSKGQPGPGPLLSRKLLHNTVRIEAQTPQGTRTGTGFFYSFRSKSHTNGSFPVVITCWHVIANSTLGHYFVSQATSNNVSDSQSRVGMVFVGEKAWLRHPDKNVDLAVLPIAEFLTEAPSRHWNLEYSMFSDAQIPTQAELAGSGVFQELKFIGYPIGLWDETNNLPIMRRGMSATDPSVDYNGQPKFLMDAAVFPGSSGSPVMIANDGLVAPGFGTSPELSLLGILSEVYQYDAHGQLEIVKIPTAFDAQIHTAIPANLGVVIKSKCLERFVDLLEAQVTQTSHATAGNK